MLNKDKLGFGDPDEATLELDGNDRDRKLTREEFRKFAMAAMESCIAIPYELWDTVLPQVVLKFRNNYEVFVGIRDAEEEPDDPYVQSLVADRNRYEKALKRLASATQSPFLQNIIAAALGEVPEKKG